MKGRSTKYPSFTNCLQRNPDFNGLICAIFEIDPVDLSDAVERISIAVPKHVLTAADRHAAAQGFGSVIFPIFSQRRLAYLPDVLGPAVGSDF